MDVDATIASIFWAAALNAIERTPGHVPFCDLWPKGKHFRRNVRSFVDLDAKVFRKLAMYAARTCIWHAVETLIDLSAIRVSVRCSAGRSLLHLACVLDNYDGVRLLLAKGADVFAIDDAGELPIGYAKDSQLIRLLSGVMKQRQFPDGGPAAPTTHKTAPFQRKQDDNNRSKQEMETLFFLIRSSKKHFPFEDIAMKIKSMAPDIFYVVDEPSGDRIIHATVRVGVIAVPLLVLLAQHYNVDCNSLNDHGETPLIIAVRQGSLEIADLLIVCFGADINLAGKDAFAPIHAACMADNPDAVILLLRRGARLSNSEGKFADDVAGISPICMEIIRKAKRERMEILLNLAADNSISQSPLNKSELNGVTLCVGDFQLTDGDGNTLLMLPSALLNKRFFSAALHVIKSSLYNVETRSQILNRGHPATGKTALTVASRLGNIDVIRSLISAGANPARADRENLLPVHHALMSGDLDVVAALFDNDTGLVGFEQSFQLVANRHEAIAIVREAFIRRQEHIVQPLLISAAERKSVIGLASRLEKSDIIDNISTISQDESVVIDKKSPIFLAVENCALDVVKFFVERGFNVVLEQPVTGDSLMHTAVRTGDYNLVDFLLGLEVSHNFLKHINHSGQSALHVAAQLGTGLKAIVDRLLQAGASPLLDEAAGYPAASSPYQSVQACLDKTRHDRNVMVFEILQQLLSTQLSFAENGDEANKSAANANNNTITTSTTNTNNNMNNTNKYMSAASFLFSISGSIGNPYLRTSAFNMAALPKSQSLHSLTSEQRPFTWHSPTSSVIGAGRQLPSNAHPSLSSLNIFDFYLSDLNGEHLLTAAVRQKAIPLVEQLLAIYNHLAEEFDHVTMKRSPASSEGANKHEQHFTSQTRLVANTLKTAKLIHPCLLKSEKSGGATALHVAVQISDNRDLVFLLANACEASVCAENVNGLTPLQLAVMLSRRRAFSVLVRLAASDLNCRTSDGKTLEQLATNKYIRRRLRVAREKTKDNSVEDKNNDIDEDGYSSSSTSSSASSHSSPVVPLSLNVPANNNNNDSVDSADSLPTTDDDYVHTADIANGLPRRTLQQLLRRLDFVSVLKQYSGIQKTFTSETTLAINTGEL